MRKLIAEVTAESKEPIRVERIARSSEDEVDQGRTFYDNPKEILVRVISGVSQDYHEAILSHEYFHILLRNRGYSSKAGIPASAQGLGAAILEEAKDRIVNCPLDALIQKETAKRGFRSELLPQREAEATLRSMRKAISGNYRLPDIMGAAIEAVYGLKLYCLQIRSEKVTNMADLESAATTISPNIVRVEKQLIATYGTLDCDSPRSCFERSIALRDAIGLNGKIMIMSPVSGNPE